MSKKARPSGAALLAAVGTGAFATVPEACAATLRTTEETRADPAKTAVYAPYHALYRTLYPALKPAFAEAARIAMQNR